MNTQAIDEIVRAAQYIADVFTRGESGDFGPNCSPWYDGTICDCLDVISRLEWLEKEYTGNCLEAAGASNPDGAKQAINEYYDKQVGRCAAYEDCGLYSSKLAEPTPWPVSKEWLCRDFDNDAIQESKCILAWPIMRALERGEIDGSTASELLVKAYQFQSSYARKTAAIREWWSEICPKRNVLENLARYPRANTKRAQEYFDKAISIGYMRETDTGYEWLLPEGRGRWAALGYFLGKVYPYEIPQQNLGELFNYKQLGHYKRASRTLYATMIDSLFND